MEYVNQLNEEEMNLPVAEAGPPVDEDGEPIRPSSISFDSQGDCEPLAEGPMP